MADAELTARKEARGVDAVASLDLPVRSVVRSATVAVHAEPAGGQVQLDKVARVRPSGADPGTQFVVDFGAPVIVGELKGPKSTGIVTLAPWVGSQFGDAAATGRELRTDRLLVTVSESVSAAIFATESTVSLPAPPADLDLAVGGARQWFAAGPARNNPDGTFDTDVDVTTALQAAVAAGRRRVPVALRSSTPGLLRVSPKVRYLEVHAVVFPEGAARTVEATAEGTYSLALPLPPEEASSWKVQGVRAVAAARIGPERILPALEPERASAAQLVLDLEHAIAVRLPDEAARFAQLTALRLWLAAAPEGAELAGTLLAAGEKDEPGRAIPNTQLGPLTLDPGAPFDPETLGHWVTLPLATPYAPPRHSRTWASLELARGAVLWPLGTDASTAAVLRRPTPNGFAELSKVAGVETGSASLRVAGIAPSDEPVPALVVSMPNAKMPNAKTPAVELTPTPEGTPFAIAAPDGAKALGSSTLELGLTIATPGSYTFSAVHVEYTT